MAEKKKGKLLRKVEYQTQRAISSLLEGTILVVDPSSGSASSQPGYALFSAGVLTDSGTLKIDYTKEVPRRLQDIAECLRNDFQPVDVLIIEDIPVLSFGRNAHAHATLLKSVGCILSAAQYGKFVEVSPSVWHAYIAKDPPDARGYIKGDEWDAKIMGYCVLALARQLKKGSTNGKALNVHKLRKTPKPRKKAT